MAVRPVVDPNRCEGKAVCLQLCPTQVFVLRVLNPEERGRLHPLGWLRQLLHGGRQAFVAFPERCSGCGICVSECPESAIRLEGSREP